MRRQDRTPDRPATIKPSPIMATVPAAADVIVPPRASAVASTEVGIATLTPAYPERNGWAKLAVGRAARDRSRGRRITAPQDRAVVADRLRRALLTFRNAQVYLLAAQRGAKLLAPRKRRLSGSGPGRAQLPRPQQRAAAA